MCCWIWEILFFILLLFLCVYWFFYIFLRYTLLVICTWNKGSERMREIIFFKMLGGGKFFFITPSWVGVAFAPHFPKKLYKKCTRKKLEPGMRICSRLLSFSRFLSSRPHPPFVPEKKFNLLILSATAVVVWENFVNEKAALFFVLLLLLLLSPIKKLWCCTYIYTILPCE